MTDRDQGSLGERLEKWDSENLATRLTDEQYYSGLAAEALAWFKERLPTREEIAQLVFETRERALYGGFTHKWENWKTGSYTQFPDGQRLWNDDVWRAADYDGFKLYAAARRAIRALVRACPQTRGGRD